MRPYNLADKRREDHQNSYLDEVRDLLIAALATVPQQSTFEDSALRHLLSATVNSVDIINGNRSGRPEAADNTGELVAEIRSALTCATMLSRAVHHVNNGASE